MRNLPYGRIAAIATAVVVLAVAGIFTYRIAFAPMTIRAVFSNATAIYQGDEVRVSGVKVGTISSIEPHGTTAEIVLKVDRDVPIPADAKAIIIERSLVSNRYVQLTPAYRTTGRKMRDGATIPLERTAVPVEWDEVQKQLTRLATDLGPDSGVSSSSLGRFINSAADAMNGNGDKLRQTLAQLSGTGKILADGSGNIADTITNLQKFVSALRDSNVQIVQFQNRLADLTSLLDDSRSDLDAALSDLSVAVGDIQRFVHDNRDRTDEQLHRLTEVTQNLVDHRADVEQLLHVFPTSLANFYNIYNPDTGTEDGVFTVNNFTRPINFVCSAITSLENATAAQSGEKCRQYLGPVLGLLQFNYLPFPISPLNGPTANRNNLIYTDPSLIPQVTDTHSAPPVTPLSLPDILFPGGRR